LIQCTYHVALNDNINLSLSAKATLFVVI